MSDSTAAGRWLAQARADLDTARALANSRPYAACFFAQQAAEKAAKAVDIAASGALPRTHSLLRLREQVVGLQAFIERPRAARLDRLYTATRYPDALPDVIPAAFFQPEDAAEAIADAASVMDSAARLLAQINEPTGDDHSSIP